MFGWLKRLFAILGSSTGLTEEAGLETPLGPRDGEAVGGPLQILGVARLSTTSGNQRRASGFEERVTLDVPVGTIVIVPALETTVLGFGEDEDPDPLTLRWEGGVDHHWGIGVVHVQVEDINAPDTSVSPPTQSATILVKLHLSDKNGDDRWVGQIVYHLLFLGTPVPERPEVVQPVVDWTPLETRRAVVDVTARAAPDGGRRHRPS